MNKEALIAINKWVYFALNYPSDFIEKVWGERKPYNLTDHLIGKFNDYYDRYGSNGAVTAFYANLDQSNQIKLMDWVMSNYNDEQKLRFKD